MTRAGQHWRCNGIACPAFSPNPGTLLRLACHAGAHRLVLVAVLGQPALSLPRLLLTRMEIGAQVLAPGAVSLAHEAASPEQEGRPAFPGVPAPQGAVMAQIVQG